MRQQINFPENAAAYFKHGYNCAQSVLLTMQEYYNYPKNELIPKIASAFGGGVGRSGSLCGALTGATMVIGMKHGTNDSGTKKREKAYSLTQKFYERFTEEFGTPYCRELIGYDLTNPEELEKAWKANVFEKKCAKFVKKTIEILTTMEKENVKLGFVRS